MKRTKIRLSTRLTALLISLVLLAGMLPVIALTASAADSVPLTATKVADPSTMDGWKAYFGPDQLSTEFAGGVWTDKSVFTDAASYQAAGGSSKVTLEDENAFLVALSAIAANKEVTGLSSVPTDTMLILDLSQSMDNIGAVSSMVQATNSALSTLLNDNRYNRVGVVLYSGSASTGNSGTSTATVILPLDRYTASNQGTYLSVSGSSDTTVSVANGVRNSNNQSVSGSKNTVGGTYIQNGLYKAWQEFQKTTDPVISESGSLLDGMRRTPIYVLMSDGAPTSATESYNSVGTSNTGDGTSSSDRISFLTQLTAAYVKGKAAAQYGTDALFYTLGLGTSNSQNATSVLNPSQTNTTVSGYWTKFLAGAAGSNVEIIPDSPGWGDSSWSLYRDAAVTARNYVTQYYYAADSSDMLDAFENIVSAIQLQSAYNATLVDGSIDLSGYISFEDEIGQLMEVRDVKGLVIGDTLFTGSELAKSINEGNLGSAQSPSEAGNKFMQVVQKRIGVDLSTAQALAEHAYNAKQLSYVSASDYSNYIGWYSDADGKYVSFWQESYGMGADTAPANAKYINKSYGYLGEAGDSDTMYVVVNVRQEIKTTHQDVLFQIPASLIPMVTYKVTTSGTTLESATKLERVGAEPISLVYEAGLRSDINPINLEDKIAEYKTAHPEGHVHSHDGEYAFYSNSWGTGSGNQNPVYDLALIDNVANSHFVPSYENERYYHVVNAPIYTASGSTYVRYTGATAPTGEGYYFRRTVVTAATNGGAATAKYIYEEIEPEVLRNPGNLTSTASGWEIKAGTDNVRASSFGAYKGNAADSNGAVGNNTETLEYAFYNFYDRDEQHDDIYAFLGNNGKLSVTAAQGIRLSKEVAQVSDKSDAPTEFTFEVTLQTNQAGSLLFTDKDGNTWSGSKSVQSSGSSTVITLKLADGQEVLISGIPENTAYTVKEIDNLYYNSDQADNTVIGTVSKGTMTPVRFVNTATSEATLTVSKNVVHPFATDPTALSGIAFTVQVALGSGAANKSFTLAEGGSVTANDSGVVTLTLHHNEAKTIRGLLEGASCTVTESSVPGGYTLDTAASTNVGTPFVLAAGNNAAHVVNNYTPAPPIAPAITVKGTKTVDGPYTGNESFQFIVERYVGVSAAAPTGYVQVGSDTALADGTYTVSLSQESLTTVGNYYYRISEVAGASAGMAYDVTQGLFVVRVTDDDMDGTMEYTVADRRNTAVTQTGSSYTVTKDFTNTYSTTATYADIHISKVLNNDTGVDVALNTFRFGLYKSGLTDPVYTAVTNAAGNATIRIPLAEAGTFHYTLKEIVPTPQEPGMQYDTAERAVTVTVTDVASQLQAVIQIDGEANSSNAVSETFTNTYDLTDTNVVLQGTKELLRGYDNQPVTLAGGEFTFQLLAADASFNPIGQPVQVSNKADGSFQFDSIPYSKVGTYHYIIREVKGSDASITYDGRTYFVIVTVAADGAALKATATYRATGASQNAALAAFTNVYNVRGTASTTITGSKHVDTLQGSWQPAGGEFTFELRDSTQKVIDTAVNAPNGSITFKPLTYSAADVGQVFTYTVTEKKDTGKAYIGYSDASYTVTVEVKDKGDGTIEAVQAISGSGTAIAFKNTYTAKATGTTFSGTKALTGRTLKDGDFTFNLYASDKSFSEPGKLVDSQKNVGNGFTVSTESYTATGTYYYILSEEIPEEREGVSYDTSEYLITVRVVDRGIGQLEVVKTVAKAGVENFSGPISFSNIYTPDNIQVDLNVQKILVNNSTDTIGLDGFKFILDGDAIAQTGKLSDADGKASFGLTFTQEHIGGVYNFTITEENAGIKGMTYDGKVHEITIAINQADNGQLVPVITVNGTPAAAVNVTFTNTYDKTTTPDTGDHFELSLVCAALVLSGMAITAMAVIGKKKYA